MAAPFFNQWLAIKKQLNQYFKGNFMKASTTKIHQFIQHLTGEESNIQIIFSARKQGINDTEIVDILDAADFARGWERYNEFLSIEPTQEPEPVTVATVGNRNLTAAHAPEARAKAGKTRTETINRINTKATEIILTERSQGAGWSEITSKLNVLGIRNSLGNEWSVTAVIKLYNRIKQVTKATA